jgi:hypothetical protein
VAENRSAGSALRGATAAAAAWVETYIECEALEWFNFDPDWDPVQRMA